MSHPLPLDSSENGAPSAETPPDVAGRGPATPIDRAPDSATASTDANPLPAAPSDSYVNAIMELTKIRLTGLVVVTTGVGYLLATTPGRVLEVGGLVGTMFGTTLVAIAASILNQVWEIPFDRRMERTRGRPLITGRIGLPGALLFAAATLGGGVWVLLESANLLAALLAILTLVSYVLIYTPLKRRITANTLVGAVPGALPTLIGWAAATGELPVAAWSLFAILFCWQIPHFLAIAWLYREDYARGGFQMLSVVDPTGKRSGLMAVLYALALLPISMAPALLGVSGRGSLFLAPLLGLCMLIPALRFLREPSRATARKLFLSSLIYVPLIFGLLLCDPSAPLADRPSWMPQ